MTFFGLSIHEKMKIWKKNQTLKLWAKGRIFNHCLIFFSFEKVVEDNYSINRSLHTIKIRIKIIFLLGTIL
jgi:hypothetical protein